MLSSRIDSRDDLLNCFFNKQGEYSSFRYGFSYQVTILNDKEECPEIVDAQCQENDAGSQDDRIGRE
jgi:uncharacterized protein affecting Mg2+/Co2+ transport